MPVQGNVSHIMRDGEWLTLKKCLKSLTGIAICRSIVTPCDLHENSGSRKCSTVDVSTGVYTNGQTGLCTAWRSIYQSVSSINDAIWCHSTCMLLIFHRTSDLRRRMFRFVVEKARLLQGLPADDRELLPRWGDSAQSSHQPEVDRQRLVDNPPTASNVAMA